MEKFFKILNTLAIRAHWYGLSSEYYVYEKDIPQLINYLCDYLYKWMRYVSIKTICKHRYIDEQQTIYMTSFIPATEIDKNQKDRDCIYLNEITISDDNISVGLSSIYVVNQNGERISIDVKKYLNLINSNDVLCWLALNGVEL